MFDKLAPNFSSLRNLETLSLTERIHDFTSLQHLDRLTQLTINFEWRCACDASLALVCPRNLLQLEISNHSYLANDGLAIDKVCCLVIARLLL